MMLSDESRGDARGGPQTASPCSQATAKLATDSTRYTRWRRRGLPTVSDSTVPVQTTIIIHIYLVYIRYLVMYCNVYVCLVRYEYSYIISEFLILLYIATRVYHSSCNWRDPTDKL